MMAGEVSSGNTDEMAPISGINVTPFVDVVLVLLVIFMLTASTIAKGSLEVELPRAASAGSKVESTVNLVLRKDGVLLLDGAPPAIAAARHPAAVPRSCAGVASPGRRRLRRRPPRNCDNGHVRNVLRAIGRFFRAIFGPPLRLIARFLRWIMAPIARGILNPPFFRKRSAKRLLDTTDNAPEHTLPPQLKQLKTALQTVPRTRRLAVLEEALANPDQVQAQQEIVASNRALRRASQRKGGPPQQFQRRGRMR